jgi:hypothetical protein
MKAVRSDAAQAFDPWSSIQALVRPADVGDWVTLATLLVLGIVIGLATAAVAAARHGAGRTLD